MAINDQVRTDRGTVRDVSEGRDESLTDIEATSLQGVSVGSASPTEDQALTHDGTSWTPRDVVASMLKGGGVFNACHAAYGADPSNSGAANTSAIQSAITACENAGGGVVWVSKSGTYELDAVADASNPTNGRSGVSVAGADINIHLGPGVTLQWADDAINDTDGAADLIFVKSDVAGTFTLWNGGELNGNTAGQTNWTGGYQQNGPAGLRAETQTGDGGAKGDACVFSGRGEIVDFFGNAVIVRDFEKINASFLRGRDCGEGLFFGRSTELVAGTLIYEDDADVAVGDAIEPTVLGSVDIETVVVRAANGGAGSAVDAVGSSDVSIGRLLVDGWGGGLGSGSLSGGYVSVGKIVARNMSGNPIQNIDGADQLEVGRLFMIDCTGPFQIRGGASDTPYKIGELVYRDTDASHDDAVLIAGSRTVVIGEIDIQDPGRRGLRIVEESDGEEPVLRINGGRIVGSGASGETRPNIFIQGSGGGSAYTPDVKLVGVDLSGASGDPIALAGAGENTDNVKVINCPTPFTNAERLALGEGSVIYNSDDENFNIRTSSGWIEKGTALTAADGSTVDGTYGTQERDVIQNLVTRVAELESRLQDANILT